MFRSGKIDESHIWDHGYLFPQDAQNVRPARPQRMQIQGVPLRYVEDLNDARTTLADVFSILLERVTLHQTRFENGRPIPPRLAETLSTTTRAKSPSVPASTSA